MKNILFTIFFCFYLITCLGQVQKLTIPSDDIELNAYLYKARGEENIPTIIWCHGNPGGKVDGKSKFAKRLNEHGINVLKFNYRGLWGTEGIYTPGNTQRDLKHVLDYLYQEEIRSAFQIDTSRIIVAGYSHGSNVTIVSALHDERIREIICLGLADFSYLGREFFNPHNKAMREFNLMAKESIWDSGLAPNYEEYTMDILFNNYKYDFVAQAEKLENKRMYFIIGMNDVTVPIENHFFPLYRELKKMGHGNFAYEITDSDHGFAELYNGRLSLMISQWIKSDPSPKVTGIGGIFFRSKNPEEIREWYGNNLGLAIDDFGSPFEFRNANRPDEINYLRWSPFDEGTDYFDPSEKQFMINYRVQNIEGLAEKLRENGVNIVDSITEYDYGKFLHIMDPEGNKIELWEPVDSVLTQMGGETTK